MTRIAKPEKPAANKIRTLKPGSSITLKHPVCIVADCGNPVYARGLCERCVRGARRLIDQSKTSWEELEKLGMAVPKTTAASFFSQKFEAAKQSRSRSNSRASTQKGR
jgi:hypothetical protein